MSKEEILLKLVLDKLSNIKEILNATEDIENFLIKLKLNEKEGICAVLDKTKNVVDSLYDHSEKMKEEFYNQYDSLQTTANDKNEYNENSTEENLLRDNNPLTRENLNCKNNNPTPNISNVCLEDHTESPMEDGDGKGNKSKEVDTEEENHSNHLQEDPLKDSEESSDKVETSITEKDEDEENADNEKKTLDKDQTCEENERDHKTLIRLVDLSKLIDPNQKKSVKFDSSIIILTSSDEENNTLKKISDTKGDSGKLKSSLKKSFCSPDNDQSKKDGDKRNSEDCSKLRQLLKSRPRKKHKSDSELSDRLTDSDTRKSSEKIHKKARKHRKTSGVSSDSDIQEIYREDEPNAKGGKSSGKEGESIINKNKIQYSSKSESDNLSESESNFTNKETKDSLEKGLRKSGRIQTKEECKQEKKSYFRKMFNRISRRSNTSSSDKNVTRDISSDSESEFTTKRKLSSKKNNLVEKHLSDSSSLSDTGIDIITANTKVKKNIRTKNINDCKLGSIPTDINGEKFEHGIYIPLPKIECSKLKEIYLKNKEIFEIKRLTNVNLQNNHKRCRGTKNDNTTKSSSDGEKPKSKKYKKVPENRTSSNNEESSDDEPLRKPSDNVKANEVDSLGIDQEGKQDTDNEDERMADIAMEELRESDKEEKNSKSSNNESEAEVDKLNEKQQKNNTINADAKEKCNEENETMGDNEEEKSSKDKHDTEKNGNASSSDSEELKKKKKKWRNDKLLTLNIDSTDSEEELKKCFRKDKSKDESMSSDDERKSPIIKKRKLKKRVRKAVVLSDSEGSNKDKSEHSGSSEKSESSNEENSNSDNNEKEEANQKKPARKRIRTKDSSSSDDDISTRKNIRRVIGRDSLSETTKQAEAEEKERKARIAEKQRKYNKLFEAMVESKVEKLILDYDEKRKKELLAVDKKLVKKLKPHQASGIQFMWDACFESLERAVNTKGSGCILAHCMGLGKTLQVIALSHTLLTNVEKSGVHKIMVVCPLNTVLNWKSEFKKWLPKEDKFEVYELVSCKQHYERQYYVQEWHNDGGVLIIGYNMFRTLSNPDNKRLSKKMRNTFNEGLVDPGPDLVVCDEGHLLKNEKTHLSISMNRIKTARRIVLTGTPLQNNLKEYWCMVQFIKPNLLGTYKEYLNRFVNPITNGQYTDSTQHDILLMRKRSHVLHKLLDGVVQRRDYAVLEPYLPPKQEYVLFIKLTETQVKLYRHYMEKFARQADGSNRTSFLFADFQAFQRICTHPRVLLERSKEKREKEFDESEESEGSLKDFIDDGDESSRESSESSSGSGSSNSNNSDKKKENKTKGKQQRVRVTRAQAAQRRENNVESDPELEELKKEWFQEYCDGEELDNINNSGKLFLLFQILKECEEIGDKVLVFSQSLYALNCIEYFLEKIDEATQNGNPEKVGGHSGSWSIGLDYFRLDGTSSCDNRAAWCDMFNNPNNTRARLFLISTRAGGLGINLIAANRVIIFDVSWNPSHDIQSIYRVYRFGQTKPCYIYRFVTYGTMEMKIYERQVTKQAISKRVIDEQQIDRHYNQNDLQELYKCDLNPAERPIPLVPKDVLLGEMLQKYENTIYNYHIHQSLLENKEDEGLNEEERKAAWEEFENEKVLRKNTGMELSANARVNAQAIEAALANIVRKDNPSWTDIQIKGIIPALVQQLQVQLSEGDLTMYTRVQQEIQLMQEMQAQKFREAYYQQQVMRMIQRQQQQAKMLGNLSVNPAHLARVQGSNLNNMFPGNMNQGGPSTAPWPVSNDVIELND